MTPDGIYYEQDSPLVLDTMSASSLGAAVKKAFELFSVRAKNLRDAKKTDWPALHVSGCRTIKLFAAEFCALSVDYLNSSGAFARASIALRGDEDYSLSTEFNPRLPDEEIGKSIIGVIERAKRLVQ